MQSVMYLNGKRRLLYTRALTPTADRLQPLSCSRSPRPAAAFSAYTRTTFSRQGRRRNNKSSSSTCIIIMRVNNDTPFAVRLPPESTTHNARIDCRVAHVDCFCRRRIAHVGGRVARVKRNHIYETHYTLQCLLHCLKTSNVTAVRSRGENATHEHTVARNAVHSYLPQPPPSHSLESNSVPFVFVSDLRVAYRRNVSLETMYLYKNESFKSTGFLNMCSHNVVSTGCNKSPLCILCYFKMNDVIDNPADCEVRSVIRFLNARHLKPAEIYRQFKEVYGDTVMNERNVRKWCEMFNNGRTNVHDETRPGRPSLITEDLKTKVNDRILQDRRTSLDELHIAFPDISRSLLGEIVSQHLGYHKICARWVPRQLSDQQKTQRMASALTFLKRYHTDGDAFLDQIVTGDETWVSHNTPETKRQSRVLLLDFMPKGTTINANRYCETLRKLRRAIQNKRRGMLSRGVVLLHDNARLHTAASTRELLDQFGWEIFDHPPYSPDLALSDFRLFTKLKDFLGGTRFGSDEDLKKTVNTWLNELAAEEYNTGILKLVNRYDKCLNVGGDYVEKLRKLQLCNRLCFFK
ncbi:hypothetical protein ANN_16078 [Periplaneta americana]|uniref:Mos1 transposase HTH domain-containing protein n=1 Tax=Periplaneta americana TaxID=6978 RepID=A0ABQ8SI24_PERAM|nr:hypothetical protein ANN_16078 [Periplaneta americana]